MGLTAFKTFQQLRANGHQMKHMGLKTNATGCVNQLQARLCLVKSFQGIQLEEFTVQTMQAYSTLFKVFLTHSALECFVEAMNISGGYFGLEPVLEPYDPVPVMQVFRQQDKGDKLYTFLYKHLDPKNKKLRSSFVDCKEGRSANVAVVSAAIRHIFAHGKLTAHAAEPRSAQVIGIAVSDFLYKVMDIEFTKCITRYCEQIGFDPNNPAASKRGSAKEPVAIEEASRQ